MSKTYVLMLQEWEKLVNFSSHRSWKKKLDIKLANNKIHYQRREIILFFYPPFQKEWNKVSNTKSEINKKKKRLFEKDWGVIVSSKFDNTYKGFIHNFTSQSENSSLRVLNRFELSSYKPQVDKIICEINPFEEPLELIRQLVEIHDLYNVQKSPITKENGKYRINFPMSQQDQLNFLIRDKVKINNTLIKKSIKTSYFKEVFSAVPQPLDLYYLLEYKNKDNENFRQVSSAVIQKYPRIATNNDGSKKVATSASAIKRLKAICKYCERFKAKRSNFYKKIYE
jgi:hypothetical protein